SLPCSRTPRFLPSFPTRRSSDLRLTRCSVMHKAVYTRDFSDLDISGASIIGHREHGPAATGSGPYSGPRRRVFTLGVGGPVGSGDRKSTRLNSSHVAISYAVFCL